MGTALALAVLNGTHEVARYNVMNRRLVCEVSVVVG
jgi:hypothetical protein